MFTGICIFVVFWYCKSSAQTYCVRLEVYHTPSEEPVRSIKRFQVIFLFVDSTQVILIVVLCLLLYVDMTWWNGRNTPLLFQIFPAIGGVYWIVVSSIFLWYYFKSKKRLGENMNAVGQQTVKIMSRVFISWKTN